jgi:hypothetical protein
MKIILFIPLLFIFSCKKPIKKPAAKLQTAVAAPDTTTQGSTTSTGPDNSKYYTTKDRVVIMMEPGDTDSYSKEAFNHIVDTHPEFFSDEVVDPDLAYYSTPGKEGFNSEAGQDAYYDLYAYFLKQKNGIDKYAERRKKLIDLYENINSLFANLKGGGTYFGHQGRRIRGYAEFSVYLYKQYEKRISQSYDISEQKALYIRSLKLLAGNHDKELNKIVNKISQDITDIFYLQRAQAFQYSNYEYYD